MFRRFVEDKEVERNAEALAKESGVPLLYVALTSQYRDYFRRRNVMIRSRLNLCDPETKLSVLGAKEEIFAHILLITASLEPAVTFFFVF